MHLLTEGVIVSMKIQYSYKSFPECPEATELSRRREEQRSRVNMLLGIPVMLGIIGTIAILIDMFNPKFRSNVIYLPLTIGVGVLFFFLCKFYNKHSSEVTERKINEILEKNGFYKAKKPLNSQVIAEVNKLLEIYKSSNNTDQDTLMQIQKYMEEYDLRS